MNRRLAPSTAAALAALVVTGCRGAHSALDPAGPVAGRVYRLWQLFFWVSVVVWVVTIAFAFLGAWRSRRAADDDRPDLAPDPAGEHRLAVVVGSAIVATVVVLFLLLIGEFYTARKIGQFGTSPDPVTIDVVGHQWWWEVRYKDAAPNNVFTTANEIHVPVGRPVEVSLQSSDVIHSFWVPNLAGKKDLVPGHPTKTYFQADRPGVYYGQCAEFCGYQHAMMRLLVIAEPQDRFDQWLADSRGPAKAPQTDSQKRGQAVFLSTTCMMCHTIAGTPARGRLGPELSRVGSRQTIAAGSLVNTRGNLGGWIIDPQHIKPGTRMPRHNNLSPDDLEALIDYLESLK
jgi:cytochrome c oxidase subunit 2